MQTKTFQLNLIEGHAIINDRENIILIDTGSPGTIHSENILNFMDNDFAVNQSYSGVTIPNLCDLIGTRITTLLGMDRLKDYKIIFDYPNKRITFSNDSNLKFEGETITLKTVMGIPVVDAKVNKKTIPCFFDTGAKLSYLKSAETQNMPNLGELNDFYPGYGRFQSSTFEIETQVGSKIFPVIYANLPFQLENQLLRLINGNNGILGYDFLKKYRISMDVTLNEFRIVDSSSNDIQFRDDFENEMPDFMKYDNLKKKIMNKPIITRRDYNKIDIAIAIANNSAHIVFVADSGNSMYMSHIPEAGRLNYEQAAQNANRVNMENETGTLHPLYAVTMVPLSVFGNRNEIGDRDAMRVHIKDVFKANEEQVKLPEIFFCFEPRPDFDYLLVKEIINELWYGENYHHTQLISIL